MTKFFFLLVILLTFHFSACSKKESPEQKKGASSPLQKPDDWSLFEDETLRYKYPSHYQTGSQQGFWIASENDRILQGSLRVIMREKGKNLEEYYLESKREFPTAAHSKPVKQRFPYSDCVWFTYKDHRENGVEAHCYSRSGKYFESSSSFTRANARDDEKDKEYLRNFQKFLKSVEIK